MILTAFIILALAWFAVDAMLRHADHEHSRHIDGDGL